MRAGLCLAFLLLVLPASTMLVQPEGASGTSPSESLPKIAPAPEFTLTSQDGAPISLTKLRGRVVAVTFIFTRCRDTSPGLTPMIAPARDPAGDRFLPHGALVSLSFYSGDTTPERD